MVRLLSLAFVASVLVCAEPASACKLFRRSCVYYSTRPAPRMPHADEVVLKWKFQMGQPFFQELEMTTDQAMKVMGQDLKQAQRQTYLIRWTPMQQDSQGNSKLAMKIEGIKMEIDIGGNKIAYDSITENAPQNPLSDFFRKLMALELTYTLSPDCKILRVEGQEELVSELTKDGRQIGPLMEKTLSHRALTSLAEPTFLYVPCRAVRLGERWSQESTLDMGPLGKFVTNYQFIYRGFQGPLSKIEATASLTFETFKEASGLPFKIKNADLKSRASQGEILFDSLRGRLASSMMSMDLGGSLIIEVGGMETTVKLSQTHTVRNRIFDRYTWMESAGKP